ncbi:MAG: protein DA1 [Deltaproteobacteria bacterium]|nr:MAG: protein DA1 [Deltaproteobacteria bacterium]
MREDMKRAGIPLAILLLSLLSLTAAGPLAAKTLKCAYCHQEIVQGSYYTVAGQSYHATCYRRMPICRICGRPITDRIVIEGDGSRHYHPACHDRALRCRICGLTIDRGRYVSVGTAFYHQRCYHDAAKCVVCGKAIVAGERRLQTPDGPIHADCERNALKCPICGHIIRGSYHVDLYGRIYCPRHDGKGRCDVCHYPEAEFELEDGRHLCRRCGMAAVFSEERARRLFDEVRRVLAVTFGFPVGKDVTLHLVSQEKLRSLEGPTDSAQLGKFIRRTSIIELPFGFSRTLRDTFDIYILSGLPQPLFEGVCVHELLHAWQARHAPEDQETIVTEGVAELLSYLFLEQKGARVWMTMIEENRSDLYREGFKRAYALYTAFGLEYLRDFAATEQAFPSIDRFPPDP